MENQEGSLTEIKEYGEFGLIDHLTSQVQHDKDKVIRGIGDDAAVIAAKNEPTLVTTDMLIEGVHFDLSYTPMKHLGYKAVISNLSDIYAMNASPSQFVVSVAVTNHLSVESLEALYEGMNLACSIYGVELIGGDTTSSTTGMVINITMLGHQDANHIAYRNGAKVNDLVCVSGDLGGAYMGLQLLEREKKIFLENPKIQPDLSNHDYVLERQLKPEARKDIIDLLQSHDIIPTSMIDVSDGLSSEIMHICKQSDVGCSIYENKIPIDPVTVSTAEEFNMSPLVAALNGGEDYELLFTVSMDDYKKIESIKEIATIGHITDKGSGTNLITTDEQSIPLTAQGWNSFSEES